MAEHVALHEKLAESVRKFPVLYDKSSNDFKDKHKKERAWGDMAKEVCFATDKSLLNHFLCCFDTGLNTHARVALSCIILCLPNLSYLYM